MKKIILILMSLLLFSGCSNKDAKDEVINYFNKFKNHDIEVKNSLEELISNENLTNEQSAKYELIMKKQYQYLEYKIVEEIYNGDHANINVEITVYDYLNSQKKAEKYLNENRDKFLIDNSINELKYKNLQLSYMEEESKRIKYTLEFNVNYINNKWVLETPNHIVLQKIHGIYNYESS